MDASQRPVLSPVLRRVSTTPAGGKTVMPERIDIRAVLAVAAKPGCVSLGRSEVCDVTLRGPDRVKNLHMSRIQAELRLSSEGVVLQFLGNTGLSVNRKALRARESVWLRDGDVVEFSESMAAARCMSTRRLTSGYCQRGPCAIARQCVTHSLVVTTVCATSVRDSRQQPCQTLLT